MASRKLTYRDAGVNTEAHDRWVERAQRLMRGTYGPRACGWDGAFAGMFRLDFDEQLFRRNYRQPVLVATTDGIGTKALLAARLGQLRQIGADLVAVNVNDLITCGAEPLFFLDYIAAHALDAEQLVEILEGAVEACRAADCALIGGETAQMPAVYHEGAFDLAGFAVGVVELDRRLHPSMVESGDRLIGLASSGIHANGFSLVRKLIDEKALDVSGHEDVLGESLGAALLKPVRMYAKPVLRALQGYRVKQVVRGMAHITGGGLAANVLRMLPAGCGATIDAKSWEAPPVFEFLQRHGISREEMYRVFNMGIGFVLAVRPAFVNGVRRRLEKAGERTYEIGRVRHGGHSVTLR